MKIKTQFITSLGIITTVMGVASFPLNTQANPHSDSVLIARSSTESLFQRGLTKLEAKEYEGAIADFSAVINSHPYDPAPYTNRGIAYQKLGNYDKALADFNKAASVDPRNGLAYLNRGILHYEQGDKTQANAYFNSGIICFKRDLDAATHGGDQSKIAKEKRFLGTAHSNRGDVRVDLERLYEALKDYDQAIELDSNNAKAYLNRGTIFYQQKNYDVALSDFNDAIRLDPQLAQAYNNRGVIYHIQGNHQQAMSDFETAKNLEPQNQTFINNYNIASGNIENNQVPSQGLNKSLKVAQDNSKNEALSQINQIKTPTITKNITWLELTPDVNFVDH